LPAPPQPQGTLETAHRMHQAQAAGGYETVDVMGGGASDNDTSDDVERTLPTSVAALMGLLPEAFQTPMWRETLKGLHLEPPLPPEEIAEALAGTLEDAIEHDRMPDLLQGFEQEPFVTLTVLAEKLPVSNQRPEWVLDVIRRTLDMLVQDGFLPAEMLGEQARPSARSEIEAAAPTPAQVEAAKAS
jgi:hypothetical protein